MKAQQHGMALSVADVKCWGSALKNSDFWEYANKVLVDLKQYLAENNLYIDPATFTNGLATAVKMSTFSTQKVLDDLKKHKQSH